MPTYSYACTECDNKFDVVQSFTDDSMTACPSCEGRLRKLFGKVGVVFKGSGFYRTDSREAAKSNGSKSGNTGNGAESASTGPSDKSSSSSSSSDKTSSSSSGSSSGSSTPAAAASS